MRQLWKNRAKDLLRGSVGALSSSILGKPKKFAIITNGRSGSNLLVALLKQHGRVWVHSEIFGEYQLEDHGVRRAINQRTPILYLRDAFRPMAFEKAVGVKVLYHQFSRRYGEVRGIPDVWQVRDSMIEDPEIQFVHLKRDNLLSALISLCLAEESGNWKGRAYEVDSVKIDPEWAQKTLSEYEAERDTFDALLPSERTLSMTYENLAADPIGETAILFEFLGVKPASVEPPAPKQTKKAHSDYVANYDDLRRALVGSRFEHYFQD